MNIPSFELTAQKLRRLEDTLRQAGLSRRNCLIAVSVVKKWLRREAEVPGSTPSDLVVPDETTHP